jgi:hypothetical protein
VMAADQHDCRPRHHPRRGRGECRHIPQARRLPSRQARRRRSAPRPIRNAWRDPQGRQTAQGVRTHRRPDHGEHPRPAPRTPGGPSAGRRPDRGRRRKRRAGRCTCCGAARPGGGRDGAGGDPPGPAGPRARTDRLREAAGRVRLRTCPGNPHPAPAAQLPLPSAGRQGPGPGLRHEPGLSLRLPGRP